MNLKIVLTYFFILSFSSTGFLPNLKAYEENMLSISENQVNSEKKIDYESQYILSSGDELRFNFSDLPGFDNSQEIDLEGNVTLPELNRIKIMGLTINEAEELLNKQYEEFIYKPNIKIKITKYRPISVYLRGEVKNTGLYTFPSYRLESDEKLLKKRARLFDVLKSAKGVTNYADLTNVTVIRDNPKSQGGGRIKAELNLLSMLINGEQNQNIDLIDNDNILIKKSSNIIKDQIIAINKTNLSPEIMTVYVTGNVVSGGPLKISKGSSLIQAIASSGGKKMLTGNIEFLRFNDDGTNKFDSFKYDASAAVNSRKNPILMPGDVINVNKTFFGKTTSVLKEITNPLFTGLGIYKVVED